MSEILRKVGNLEPKTNYIARVRAFNELGVPSDWSEAISFNTSNTDLNGAIPTVFAIAGVRIILLQWDASINQAHDHYEINISTSANFTPNSNTLVLSPKTGTIASINKFWNGTAFVELFVNRTYFIQMYDVDQSGNKVLMGTEVSATTGISVNENGIQSQLIVADRIITGNLLADITISGSIKTGETGARLELDAGGLRGYAVDGITKNIEYKTADGSLSVIGNLSGGTIDIGGADSTSFHVDAAGNMWLGNAIYGSAPFTVSSTGVMTATSGTFGGAVTGATIDIGGADTTSFHVDSSGNMWLGASTFGSAPFKVSSSGSLTATTGIFNGDISGSTITGSSFNWGTGNIDSNGLTILENNYNTFSSSRGVNFVDSSGSPVRWSVWTAKNSSNESGGVCNIGVKNQVAGATVLNLGGNIQTVTGGLFQSGNISFFYDTTVFATFNADVKLFFIEHPADPTKFLRHGTLEGPEIGVYYRGRAKLKNGVTIVELPSYFESLTRQEERTVQVTPIGINRSMAVSYPEKGSFKVFGSPDEDVEFFWHVYAVRADVGPLHVEVDKEELKRAAIAFKDVPLKPRYLEDPKMSNPLIKNVYLDIGEIDKEVI